MKTRFLLLSLILILQVSAQDNRLVNDKLPPQLLASRNILNNDVQQHFFIVAKDYKILKQYLVEKNLQHHIISEYEPSKLFVVRANWKCIDSVFIPSSIVQFIDLVRIPREESAIDGFDLSTNTINLIHNDFKAINGIGTFVSVKENRPDSNDIDLRGRLFSTASSSPGITSHATIMATIIAGGGNSDYTGKGVAWGAGITSSDFSTLLPDRDADYQQNRISVQNHSYGTGIENYYGADAAAYDASTVSNSTLLHVFSAGNSGDKSSQSGKYTGVKGYANLTGSFKMAKNILTVGAIDSFGTIPLLSSKGPAYDGRLRPELVAFGQEGTSGAAALVSGTALLLQQAYREQNSGQTPSSSLVKAILLNAAEDVGPPGIDFHSGYGSLNAYKAMHGIINKQYFSDTITRGEVQTIPLTVAPNVHQLKITLCWNDVPANANDNRSLVNDIDLQLIHASSGVIWHPWVLNSSPHKDSLTQRPVRRRDSLNNVEQVTINNPAPGAYRIMVNGYNVSYNAQPYSIAYQWDFINQFKWRYPTPTDNIYAGSVNTLRWNSTLIDSAAKLYASFDGGSTWVLILQNINLDRKYVQWTAPDTTCRIIFRMQTTNQHFFSDTSTISSRLKTEVGFNCSDSFLLFWNKPSKVPSYTVFQMGSKYLEALGTVNDTSIILQKSINRSLYYAIAANIAGKTGVKSYTFNYSTQGLGCYIRSFLADLIQSKQGDIRLELGSLYNVTDVVIEKWLGNKFIPIEAINPGVGLLYHFIDNALVTGGNIYRARINLSDGKTVYSKSETIFYFAEMNYLVFPNPAKESFGIISKDTDYSELILYNTLGQKVLTKKLHATNQTIPVNHLKRGVYFIHVLQKGRKVYQGSIIIQ